jgi:hypothetical protein
MKKIEEIFHLHRAKSGLFSDYKKGNVAYVGNGLANNAVVGFVTPLADDKVFSFTGLAVSAFCEATVQTAPFVACGRAGNGLVGLSLSSPCRFGSSHMLVLTSISQFVGVLTGIAKLRQIASEDC